MFARLRVDACQEKRSVMEMWIVLEEMTRKAVLKTAQILSFSVPRLAGVSPEGCSVMELWIVPLEKMKKLVNAQLINSNVSWVVAAY